MSIWRRLRTAFGNLPVGARRLVASGCVLALLAAGYGIYVGTNTIITSYQTCSHHGATYLLHKGASRECVGMTDGSYVFDSSLTAVEHDIQRENARVVRAEPHDYVSVVMLLPISSSDGSVMSMTNVAEQLRGAYTEQYYANRHDVEGDSPYIRLLIGNDGFQSNQWSPATQIITQSVSSDHIVAVAGLGVSLATTKSAVEALTGAGIPVFGATLTSDDLDNIKNFVRVAPSNKVGGAAALDYIKPHFSRAILIEDENRGDLYDATMLTSFQHFPDATHAIVGAEPYDTSYRDRHLSKAAAQEAQQVVDTRISQMPTDICGAQPAVVLFAGRGRDLAELVGDLQNRPCLDKQITIISGDDVTNMPYSSAVHQGLASGVNVVYDGIANPSEWSQGSGRAVDEGRQAFATFDATFRSLFSNAPITDGNTMMAYDAMLTSTYAIRLASQPQPQPYAVASELSALQGARTVLGCSGPLSFTADTTTSDVGSNPVGKAIPILRLAPDGSSRFVTLDWLQGQPASY